MDEDEECIEDDVIEFNVEDENDEDVIGVNVEDENFELKDDDIVFEYSGPNTKLQSRMPELIEPATKKTSKSTRRKEANFAELYLGYAFVTEKEPRSLKV